MAAPPVFARKDEALAFLAEELARVGLPAEGAFTIEKQKQPGSQRLTWWHADATDGAGGADGAGADPLRCLAYLRTYVRITGGRPLPAGGLRLHKDRVWLDKPIVSALERDGFLAFEPTGHFEPSFVVTDQGRHWIATGEIVA